MSLYKSRYSELCVSSTFNISCCDRNVSSAFAHAHLLCFHSGQRDDTLPAGPTPVGPSPWQQLPSATTGAHHWGRADSQPARCEAFSTLSVIQAETQTSGTHTRTYADNSTLVKYSLSCSTTQLPAVFVTAFTLLLRVRCRTWETVSEVVCRPPCFPSKPRSDLVVATDSPPCKAASFRTLLLAALWVRVATS